MIQKKIENCTYLRLIKDSLFCDIEGVCYMNWKKTGIPPDTILFSYNNRIFYYNNYFLNEVLESSEVILKKFKYEPSSYIEPIRDYFLVFNRISRKEKNYRLINQEKKVLWLDDKNWGYKVFQDDLYLIENSKIANINLETTETLWHYTLPEGFKIFGSVQAIDSILFFSCVDANLRNSKLISLKEKTGEVLWELENLIDFQIDYKHKLLRGYQGAYYQVIDPFAGQLLVNKNLKELWDKGIDPDAVRNTITEDKLWFVSGRGKNTKFGAIDLETSEIDFIQDFPLENDGQLDKPVFHQNKFYLRDTNNVLYVLE